MLVGRDHFSSSVRPRHDIRPLRGGLLQPLRTAPTSSNLPLFSKATGEVPAMLDGADGTQGMACGPVSLGSAWPTPHAHARRRRAEKGEPVALL